MEGFTTELNLLEDGTMWTLTKSSVDPLGPNYFNEEEQSFNESVKSFDISQSEHVVSNATSSPMKTLSRVNILGEADAVGSGTNLMNSTLVMDQSIVNESNTSSSTTSKEKVVSSPHLSPNWLKNLRDNFYELVISECSKKVRDAVDKNVAFESKKEIREIRLAIIHSTLDQIENVFGGIGKPKLAEMRLIVAEMGSIYPAMFKNGVCQNGYGLGGLKGLDGLAVQMLDMLRGRDGNRNKRKEDESAEESAIPAKKGKRKQIYGGILELEIETIIFHFVGVDNMKWYKRVDPTHVTVKLSKCTAEMDFLEREHLYEESREELMQQFR